MTEYVSPKRPIQGIILMLIAMSCIGIVDAMGKRVMHTVPQLEVVGFYFLVIWLLAIGYAVLRGITPRQLLETKAPVLQVTRGVMLVLSLSMLFIALKHLPLAEATVISFTSPLWVVALSAPLLGENVGWRRWSAVIVGLCGAAIVMQPGTAIFQWLAILPLIGAIFFAFYQIVSRKLLGRDGFETTLFYSFLVGSILVLSAAYITNWKTLSFDEFTYIAVMGCLGFTAHLTMLHSLAVADASLVAPFNYVRVLWAIGLGYIWFGEVPGLWTFFGGGIVIASGLFIIWRETLKKRA
ncbi:MAG: DMT family transporter [Alphaproteobacteria bacterium]|jgi:drug/metabolite transporter (DMT)-like permease